MIRRHEHDIGRDVDVVLDRDFAAAGIEQASLSDDDPTAEAQVPGFEDRGAAKYGASLADLCAQALEPGLPDPVRRDVRADRIEGNLGEVIEPIIHRADQERTRTWSVAGGRPGVGCVELDQLDPVAVGIADEAEAGAALADRVGRLLGLDAGLGEPLEGPVEVVDR